MIQWIFRSENLQGFFSSPNAEKSGRISMMTSPWRVSGNDDGERIRGIIPNQGMFY